jgi:hypothetical protein
LQTLVLPHVTCFSSLTRTSSIICSVLRSSLLDCKFNWNWTGLDWKRPDFWSSPVQSLDQSS